MFRLVGALLVVSAAANHVVVQVPRELPKFWVDAGRADGAAQVRPITVAVTRKNIDEIEKIALSVSDPRSPKYGQHLNAAQIKQITGASDEAVSCVQAWLEGAAIKYHKTELDEFQLNGLTVRDVEALFHTHVSVVRHTTNGKQTHRAGPISVPAVCEAHVAAVFGVHGLPLPVTTPKVTKAKVGADMYITPAEIAKRYKVNVTRGSGNPKVRQAVAEFQGQDSNQADLTTFFKQFVPNAQPGDDQIYKIVGDRTNGTGIEALLDIQYIMGVAPGVLTEFWSYANDDFCLDLKQYTDKLVADDSAPLVTSISYGWQGDITEIGCTDSEIKTIDNNWASLAAKNITIIFASGDSGSGETPNGAGVEVLWPSWPASSPWVTAIGATRYINPSAGGDEEASQQFGSGSGFSTMFKQGAWQADAVSKYLSTVDPSALPPTFAKDGRATADLSAFGEGFQVIVGGGANSVGGTSASAPTVGALVSLLNDQLVAAGKPPLGFLNPLIYQVDSDNFFDVVTGDDKIGRGGEPLDLGFPCIAGWDPATGRGTPNFEKLLASALAAAH